MWTETYGLRFGVSGLRGSGLGFFGLRFGV